MTYIPRANHSRHLYQPGRLLVHIIDAMTYRVECLNYYGEIDEDGYWINGHAAKFALGHDLDTRGYVEIARHPDTGSIDRVRPTEKGKAFYSRRLARWIREADRD